MNKLLNTLVFATVFFACNPVQKEDIISELGQQKIVYTKHALCRMNCRHIDKNEVRDVISHGVLNKAKSNLEDTPCPTYAIEGITTDNQTVRIIAADCEAVTKIITVIDLKVDYECHCR